jgi:uncharacterized LabA/DUF88 family protein
MAAEDVGAQSIDQHASFDLLLDHDNIPWHEIDISQLIRCWLFRVMDGSPAGVLDVRLRAYGGWFAGNVASARRFDALTFYQKSCPAVIKLGPAFVRIAFEFADSLLLGTFGVVPIRNTYVTRASGQVLKPRAGVQTCGETDCEIKRMRRWVGRRRACPKTECPLSFSDCYVREEQKQVDVHLAVDLMQTAWASTRPTHLAVASDDSDFLPALLAAGRTVRQGSVSHLRANLRSTYLDPELDAAGVHLILAK